MYRIARSEKQIIKGFFSWLLIKKKQTEELIALVAFVAECDAV